MDCFKWTSTQDKGPHVVPVDPPVLLDKVRFLVAETFGGIPCIDQVLFQGVKLT